MDELTYREVGATAGDLPAGYHHVRLTRRLGSGRDLFDRSSERLLTWGMHRRAGVRKVGGPDRVAVGAEVSFRWLVVRFDCRVVEIVDEPDRRGFAYGTLARHPESGEERFVVEWDPTTQDVTATITAFSRPASVLTRASGPLSRLVQTWMTRRYLAALE